MRIVTKINLALAAVVGVSAILNFAALQATVAPRFAQLEDEAARRNQARVMEAIELQQNQVAASARDYAFWDDSFAYMHGRNETYEAKNLFAEPMKALNVNFFLAIEPDGRVKIDRGFEYSGEEPREIRLIDGASLPGNHPFRADFPEPGSRTGLVTTAEGVAAVGYAPILDSERNGSRAGTLLLGKLLDLDMLRTTTKVDFEFRPPSDKAGANEMTRGEGEIEVRTTLIDVEGKPIADLVSKTVRSVSAAGNQAVWAALGLLVVGGAALILTLAFILRRIALRRIGRMQSHLMRIKATGTLETLPDDGRHDELSEMVLAFNDMAAQLEAMREQLRRQDYKHGAADQAADILHNIRNAISPIGAIIADLGAGSDAPWKGNLEKALAELKQEAPGSERHGKLSQFVSLSAGRLLDEERKRGTDLKTMQGIVRHVDGILKDEEAVSQVGRVSEDINLGRQIDAIAQVISRGRGVPISVEIPERVRVIGHRLPLEQVWGNLLINASEAIAANGHGEGEISVRVADTILNDGPALIVEIKDNGDGIKAELVETIFQKGFSTRRERSGGLGLHWCANAVGAMGGRLFAQSEGPGRGATITVVLPQAVDDVRSAA